MNTLRKVFQVVPELLARKLHRSATGAAIAAPFDTPTAIIVTLRTEGGIVCEFQYELGPGEEIGPPEPIGHGRVWFGRVSGRVMRFEIPRGEIDAVIAGTAEELKIRRAKMSSEPGTPLRRAAHYELVGAELLPGLHAFFAEQLPELRRQTVG